LIHGVSNSSRAMWAVVTASFTEWQPAVLGSTRKPKDWMNCQKLWPALPALPWPAPPSRRSETVTTSAPEALMARSSTAGDG
jgi:hypothetical protein